MHLNSFLHGLDRLQKRKTNLEAMPQPSKHENNQNIQIRRPFGLGRVEPSSNLQIFKSYILSSFLLFLLSSFLPNILPQGEGLPPPDPPPPIPPHGHQPGNLFRTQTSAESTFPMSVFASFFRFYQQIINRAPTDY